MRIHISKSILCSTSLNEKSLCLKIHIPNVIFFSIPFSPKLALCTNSYLKRNILIESSVPNKFTSTPNAFYLLWNKSLCMRIFIFNLIFFSNPLSENWLCENLHSKSNILFVSFVTKTHLFATSWLKLNIFINFKHSH